MDPILIVKSPEIVTALLEAKVTKIVSDTVKFQYTSLTPVEVLVPEPRRLRL